MGPIGLPLRAMLYVRKRAMATIPRSRRWYRFATKLQLVARLVEWIVPVLKKAGKTVWIVVDGGYTLRVRFADGSVKEQKVAVGKSKHVNMEVINAFKLN